MTWPFRNRPFILLTYFIITNVNINIVSVYTGRSETEREEIQEHVEWLLLDILITHLYINWDIHATKTTRHIKATLQTCSRINYWTSQRFLFKNMSLPTFTTPQCTVHLRYRHTRFKWYYHHGAQTLSDSKLEQTKLKTKEYSFTSIQTCIQMLTTRVELQSFREVIL